MVCLKCWVKFSYPRDYGYERSPGPTRIRATLPPRTPEPLPAPGTLWSMHRAYDRINLADLRDQYLQQQLRGDRRAALHFIETALSEGASVNEVRCRIVQDAQREIGRLWLEGRIT